MTLAIGLHNIPEGLAVATVLVARGVRPRQAAIWAVATSLPQPLLAVPSFMFVETFSGFLPVALGFAAGCMVWMVFAELLPDALEDASHSKVGCQLKNGCWQIAVCLRKTALLAAAVTLESCLPQKEVQGAQLLPVHICCFGRASGEPFSLAQLDHAALLCQNIIWAQVISMTCWAPTWPRCSCHACSTALHVRV